MSPTIRLFLTVLLAGNLIVFSGCVNSRRKNREEIARVDLIRKADTRPLQQTVTERVRFAGRYHVVIRRRLWFVDVSTTQAQFDAGEIVGFRWNASGNVVALGSHREIELGPLPRDMRYVTWQSIKLDQTPPTRSAEPLERIVGVFAVAGIILYVPALIFAEWFLKEEGVLVDHRRR